MTILLMIKLLEKENKILKEKLEDSKLVYLDEYMVPISKDITTLYLLCNLLFTSLKIFKLI